MNAWRTRASPSVAIYFTTYFVSSQEFPSAFFPVSPVPVLHGRWHRRERQAAIKTKFISFMNAIGFGHMTCNPKSSCTPDDLQIFVG